MSAMPTGPIVGGNPALSDSFLEPHLPDSTGSPVWLSSGRDVYLLVSRLAGRRDWILPDFLCPVVPEVLTQAKVRSIPYRAGELKAALLKNSGSGIAVLAWDVDGAPCKTDLETAESFAGPVVEDRCLWAGLPCHVGPVRPNRFVIGSVRKWLGVAEGGWLLASKMPVIPTGALDGAAIPRQHVLAQLAASALRRFREEDDNSEMTAANLACARIAEESLGIPRAPRPISKLGMMLVESTADAEEDRMSRFETARMIQGFLGCDSPAEPGILGVRARCDQRDAALENLARAEIFAPVHWRDGDWSGSGGAAASMAATSFTIPCPPLRTRDARLRYVRRLKEALQRFTLQRAEAVA